MGEALEIVFGIGVIAMIGVISWGVISKTLHEYDDPTKYCFENFCEPFCGLEYAGILAYNNRTVFHCFCSPDAVYDLKSPNMKQTLITWDDCSKYVRGM